MCSFRSTGDSGNPILRPSSAAQTKPQTVTVSHGSRGLHSSVEGRKVLKSYRTVYRRSCRTFSEVELLSQGPLDGGRPALPSASRSRRNAAILGRYRHGPGRGRVGRPTAVSSERRPKGPRGARPSSRPKGRGYVPDRIAGANVRAGLSELPVEVRSGTWPAPRPLAATALSIGKRSDQGRTASGTRTTSSLTAGVRALR